MKRFVAIMLLACTTASAAVHPTKAQEAYFAEHEKCVSVMRAAKKEANTAPADERKKRIAAAKDVYRQCEEHARLVWKYYPSPPPNTTTPNASQLHR